ncbi:MAG: hypothetical protein AAF739_16065 [Pseudomonadota bacterium]
MTNTEFATGYYHWFFLIQPSPLPETLIGADPGFYLNSILSAWGRSGTDVFHPDAYQEYADAFADPSCISATCEDYRAAATIDLEHGTEDSGRKIASPLLLLWGANGLIGRWYDVPSYGGKRRNT